MISASNNSPDTIKGAVLDYAKTLQMLADCWNNLANNEKKYLHKEEKEPIRAWEQRVSRTTFINKFRPAITDYAGLLSVFTLSEDVAKSILIYQSDIDLLGNNLWTFFHDVDQACLRDGWCVVLVEYPKLDPSIQSQGDALLSDRRPYLVLIERASIINWRFDYIGGRPRLSRVVIREDRTEPDGEYGEKQATYFRVLYPGGYKLYQRSTIKGVSEIKQVDEGTTSLQHIPLVYYSVTESKLFTADAPFLNLAKLNIEHYQKRSQLNEVLRKCNLPVPVRRGLVRTIADLDKAPPLIIGPNSVLDIPESGDFFFAEPSGVAIGSTTTDLQNLEAEMEEMGLNFLTSGEYQKTATEVVLQSVRTTANLKGIARRKESSIQQIFAYWAQYTGENKSGGIVIDENMLQMPISPEYIDRLESLATQGLISQKMLLLLLKQGKILPRDTDIDQEIAEMDQVPKTENDQEDYT